MFSAECIGNTKNLVTPFPESFGIRSIEDKKLTQVQTSLTAASLQEATIYGRMELKSYGLKDYSILWREWQGTLGEAHFCD